MACPAANWFILAFIIGSLTSKPCCSAIFVPINVAFSLTAFSCATPGGTILISLMAAPTALLVKLTIALPNALLYSTNFGITLPNSITKFPVGTERASKALLAATKPAIEFCSTSLTYFCTGD